MVKPWPERVVVEVHPALYFHADVLVTDCGHKHLRPKGTVALGSVLICPFCGDDAGSDVNV